MLDLKFIRENKELVEKGIQSKNVRLDLAALLKQDDHRRSLMQEAESLKSQRNKANDEISVLRKEKKDATAVIDSMKSISQKIGDLDRKVGEIDQELTDIILRIPNIPHISTPLGTPESNKIVKTWGEPKKFSVKPKSHLELGEGKYFSFDRSSKISGSGFSLFVGPGARLVRGLVNFMLDMHTQKHGYTEVFPPFLVNRTTMTGTGQLPKMEEDMYRLKEEDLFLIPTAEVPVTNMLRDEILEEDQLPVKYAAYSACFRREAGSYGKDTKGLIRVHQFDKVELVKFAHPEKSFDELETLRRDAEEVLEALGLTYRVVLLASGDLSFSASKCYDLEVWAPGAEKWLEVSSCSNFTDFQARRINVKYKPKGGGKPALVHTLNASGVALPRIIIALLEIYQQPDGTVTFPSALGPYLK